MSTIHPTAIVDPTATLGPNVILGPYSIVEAHVSIAEGTELKAHAQVLRGTSLGARCQIGHGAIIGADPQSKGFDPQTPSRVIMGDDNVIREHVTIHRSLYAEGATKLGDRNFLMAGSHLGHDVIMGDDCIVANAVLLAGHVEVGSRCFLGGGAGFHQFIRIGEGCVVQGNSSMAMDIPPFCTANGLNNLAGLNVVGLRRQGWSAPQRLELKRLYHLIFYSGKNLSEAVREAQATAPAGSLAVLVDFVATRGKKGIITPRRRRTQGGHSEQSE